MRHYRKQRLLQSADNKAPDASECRQSPEYLSSRLTPSPEPSPPLLRLKQDKDTHASGPAFASNLLELYRSTDIAKVGDRNDLVEGKSSDDEFEGSEDGSRGVSACFEESTSHVVTITGSSKKECSRVGDDEDDNLIAACSLTGGLQISEGRSRAVFVETKGRLSAGEPSLEQALRLGDAESLTGETTGGVSTTCWQHTKRAETANVEDGHRRTESIKGELDSKLPDAYSDQPLPAVQAKHDVRSTAGGGAPLGCKEAENSRAVAAVRRRSLLAGGIAVAGVGLSAVACVSPWNVQVATVCIVGGLCLCTLGWIAATLKSPLLLTLHSILLFCFLLMLAVSIVLNFHWAVQSFRALRHAYFDDSISKEESSPARSRQTHITVSVFPTPYKAPLSPVPVTAATAKAAHGPAYNHNTLAPPSAASAVASSRLPTSIGAHGRAVDEKTPIGTAVDQPRPLFSLQQSNSLYAATATVQSPELPRTSPSSGHPPSGNVHGSSSSSNILQGSSFLDQRKQQWMEGFTNEGIETDKVKANASVSGLGVSRKSRSLNSLDSNNLQTPQNFLLSGPAVKTIGRATELSERSHGPCDSNDRSLLQVHSPTFLRSQSVSGIHEWSRLHLTPALEVKMTHTDNRLTAAMTAAMKGRSGDVAKWSLLEEQPGTSPLTLNAKDRGDRDESRYAPREQLHAKGNQLVVQRRYLTPNGYTRRDPFVLAAGVISFEDNTISLQNPRSVSSSKGLSANSTGLPAVTLASGNSGSSAKRTLSSEMHESTGTKALETIRYQVPLPKVNLLLGTPQGTSGIHRVLPVGPSASTETTDDTANGTQETNCSLQEGIVNPEPARCDNVPGGLLRYVHSTRRQLETYGLLCAFSRYDLWGLFYRWSVDCETGCGFKFLATKRYMWSKGLEERASTQVAAGRGGDISRLHLFSVDEIREPAWRAPLVGRKVESWLSPNSSIATVFSNMENSASSSHIPIEYLHWHAALPTVTQKACLEGALNVACSVVKSHYLMLLPPLAVLLLLISFILLGIGITALRSTIHLRCLATTKR